MGGEGGACRRSNEIVIYMDWIRSQAIVYKNLPLLAPKYRSVVHLEDDEDKVFWNEQLQKHRPGNYFYVTFSKSNNGNDTRGCDQCLKFKPYLNSRFFICIDSDLRYLMGEPGIDADHYIIQTYTYSFENHYCETNSLQASIAANANGCGFNFEVFLRTLSDALYEPFLLLLFCKRTGSNLLTEKDFRHIIKNQCTSVEAQNDGAGYVQYITQSFEPFIKAGVSIGFNPKAEGATYSARGLDKDNAYLHVRGHNIFDLTIHIGNMCCRRLRVSFLNDVLKKVAIGGHYWEYEEIQKDLKKF